MKYNELQISWGGQSYIFVTRGRSKEITTKEAIEYLKARTQAVADTSGNVMPQIDMDADLLGLDLIPDAEPAPEWSIPDDKSRRLMFMRDLRAGLEFCVKKYGVTEQQITDEARRVAPHYHVTRKLDGEN